LHDEIVEFWLRPEHRLAPAWIEHADINDVMLATSLAPNGFILLGSPGRRTSTSATDAREPRHGN